MFKNQIIFFLKKKINQRGLKGLILRIFVVLWERCTTHLDKYFFNFIFLFKEFKENGNREVFHLSNANKFTVSQKVKESITHLNKEWKRHLKHWNIDSLSKKFVPNYNKYYLNKYLKKNKIELMGANERYKLNQIVFWAISYKCLKTNSY